MKNKILQFLVTSVFLGVIYFTNISFSSGPPSNAAVTGCSCHGPDDASTLVTINFNNNSALAYNNGQTYPISITVASQNNKPGAGFAMSYNIGTLTPVSGGTQVSGNEWRHTTPKAMLGSFPSSTTWTANWTAPASGNTPLDLQAAGNAVSLSSGSANDEWNFASSINIPLPVKFKSIQLSSIHNQQLIEWTVLGEVNMKNYEIQFSSNGTDFKTFKSLEALNKEEEHTYNSILETGIVSQYYRIKASDIDGKQYYSEVVFSNPSLLKKQVSIFPNVLNSNGTLTVQNENLEAQYTLCIQNSMGQTLQRINLNSQSQKVSLNNLSSGIYFVSLKNQTSQTYLDKIIIQ